MKDNSKYVVFVRLTLLSLGITLLISACNPFQQAEEAAEAKKTSDSLMKEFIGPHFTFLSGKRQPLNAPTKMSFSYVL